MTSSSVINLYKFPLVIHLQQTDRGIRNENMPYADSDFKAHKGVQTDIDFVVRNNDRKPVNLIGKSVCILILDHESKQQVLRKRLCIRDYTRSLVQLSLLPHEVERLEEGYYDYVVLIENETGSQNILFTNQDQNAAGWFELKGGALPPLPQPIDLNPAIFQPFHVGEYPGGSTRYASQTLAGDAKLGFGDGVHTFVLYLNNFSGKVWVEASIEESTPTNDLDWFYVHLTPNQFDLIFYGESGLRPFNFNVNARWVRFVFEPNELNDGSITRIIFKP